MRVSSRDDVSTFYWLVGLFEGEACFYYSASSRIPTITVEMTDEHVVARIAAILGRSYRRRDRRHSRPATTVTYEVKIRGKQAIQLMSRMAPFLSPRRRRTIALICTQYAEDRKLVLAPEPRVSLPPLVEVPYVVEG